LNGGTFKVRPASTVTGHLMPVAQSALGSAANR